MKDTFFIIIALTIVQFANAKTLKISLSDDYNPISMGAGKDIKGITRDIVTEVFKNHPEYQLSFIGLPWLRAQLSVQNADADALVTVVTPERLAYANASSNSAFSNDFYVYTSKDNINSKLLLSSTDFNLFKNLTLCEYNGAGWAKKNLLNIITNVYYTTTIEQKMRMLDSKNRCDFIIDGNIVVDYLINSLKLKNLVKSPSRVDSVNFQFLLRKSYNDQKVLDIFDKEIKQLHSNGTIKKILNKWIKT